MDSEHAAVYAALHDDIRDSVRALCARFDLDYWRRCDEAARYPEEFVAAMSAAGWLGALIPEEYGGGGMGIAEAGIILEEINRAGGNSAACHAQMYTMGSLLRHGSDAQKRRYLPDIASGKLRLQAFGVTEPDAGSDTTQIQTFARRTDGGYVINGQKVFTSRFQHSDLLLLVARTTPLAEARKKTEGISLFLIDIHAAGEGHRGQADSHADEPRDEPALPARPGVPTDALIGEEGAASRICSTASTPSAS